MKDNGDSQYSPFDEECEFYQKSINDIINRTCLKTIVFEICYFILSDIFNKADKPCLKMVFFHISCKSFYNLKNDGF